MRPFVLLTCMTAVLCLNGCGKKPTSLEPPAHDVSTTVYPRRFPKAVLIPGRGPQRDIKTLTNQEEQSWNDIADETDALMNQQDDLDSWQPDYETETKEQAPLAREQEDGLIF
jgi:hypothetical protein